MGLTILSPEDYALSLISGKAGTMEMELAAKVIYANMDGLDKTYLKRRASELSIGECLKTILEGVEAASRR
jgi:hypothetical protein